MAVDFSALDREVDQEQLRKDVEEAKNNSGDIPKGTYIVGIDKMEIRATKDGRPMFFIQCRVKEGEYKLTFTKKFRARLNVKLTMTRTLSTVSA